MRRTTAMILRDSFAPLAVLLPLSLTMGMMGSTPGCSSTNAANGFDAGLGLSGASIGQACSATTPCRVGLDCDPTASTCVASGATVNGASCVIGDQCVSGQCGADGTCDTAGVGVADAACAGDADCGKGLRCGFSGASIYPTCIAEGSVDYGGACTLDRNCLQGLVCLSSFCSPLPAGTTTGTHGIPPYVPDPLATPWQGATCPAPKTTGPITALFTIPRTGTTQDFYSLPFPNDAARDKASGLVSFATHPHYELPEVGVDVLENYLSVLGSQPFGPYTTAYFRFDGPIDFNSIDITIGTGNLQVIDLGSPTFASRGVAYQITSGRTNKYICDNFLAVRPGRGDPYPPGTYAIVLTKGIKTSIDESAVVASTDLAALIAASAPTDAALADAYAEYAPLRAYLSNKGISTGDVVNATVFTVGDPTAIASKLRPAVRAATAPVVAPWVHCGAGVTSPCPQSDGDRNCSTVSPDFDELQTLITLPIFQNGNEPYLATSDDGSMSASPTVVKTEQVCAALTIPKGTTMPAGGWPIAIYAPGTGGSFRSHAIDGSGKMLSKISLPADGTTGGFAVLGIDQVEAGTRRGTSTASSNDLFFNFVNPAAARYNALQGAADQHSLVRVVESLTTIPSTVTGTAITLNPKEIVFWGHSQGATEGALFLPFDTSVKGAVLSGEGGGLIDALTTKTNPVDIKDSLWIALGEAGPTSVDVWHPVLSLLQQWEEPADPINFASLVAGKVTAPGFVRNIFQPWGTAPAGSPDADSTDPDTYTPWEVQDGFAVASGEELIAPAVRPPPPPFAAAATSAQGNDTIVINATPVTVVARQYTTDGTYDGHFVAYDNPTAEQDVAAFLWRSALWNPTAKPAVLAPMVPETAK